MHKVLTPAIILYFLAPAVGELLSGSTPPVEFFTPFGLIVLPALYGAGALLVREARVRWTKGWATVLVLGAAYGIYEEGLVVKSFFDPHWVDLGAMGDYSRWLDVNWVWSVMITIYHTVISIALPILLVELIFPQRRHESWLTRRGIVVVTLLFLAVWPLGYFALTTYRPPRLQYLVTMVLVGGLVWLAWRMPARVLQPAKSASRAVWFWVVAFFGTAGMLVMPWALRESGQPPWLALLLSLVWVFASGGLLVWMSGNGTGWSDWHRWATAAGALGFFIVVGPLATLDPNRIDNPAGMEWVAVAFLALVLWLGYKARQRERKAARDSTAPASG